MEHWNHGLNTEEVYGNLDYMPDWKALLRIGQKVSVIHIIWISTAKIIRIVWISLKTSVLFGYFQNFKKITLQQDCGHIM